MEKPLSIIITDIDFFIEESTEERNEPIIRIKGRDKKGKVIVIHAKGFLPYFYVKDLPQTQSTIQNLLQVKPEFGEWIVRTEHVLKRTYYQLRPVYLYKILGNNPWKIRGFSKFLMDKGIKCYENDVPFVSRFLIDTGLRALNTVIVSEYEFLKEENEIKYYITHYSNISPSEEETEYFPLIVAFKIFIDLSDKGEGEKKTRTTYLEEGSRRIIGASVTWGRKGEIKGKKHFILENDSDEEEEKLILDFWDFIHSLSPDVLVSFKGNSIDLAYIIKRMNYFEIPLNVCSPYPNGKVKEPTTFYGYRISGYMVYDLVSRSRWMRLKTGQSRLTDLVAAYLDEKREVTSSDINNLWIDAKINKDSQANLKLEKTIDSDSTFVYKLFVVLGFDEWLEVMRIVGIQPSKGIYSTARHLGEFELMRVIHKNNTIIPSLPTRKEKERRRVNRPLAEGGFVMEPKGTLHRAVLIADFTSMYPSVIVTHNIGGESFKGLTYSYYERFYDKPETALRVMEKKLLSERKELKKEIKELELFIRSFPEKKAEIENKLRKMKIKSSALKVIANSLYGSHNYIGSRFYNTDISNAITHFSRVYIEKVAKLALDFSGGKVEIVYGDTDSAFLKLSDEQSVFTAYDKVKSGEQFSLDFVPEAKDLLYYINSKLPEDMSLEFVDLALRIVFAKETKKRYSYVSVVTGNLEIIGFEAIRSDFSSFAKQVQTLALEKLLREGSYEKAKRAVINFCKEFQKKKGKELLQLVTIYGPVRKHPSEYKSKTPAIAALLEYSRVKQISIEELQKEYQRFPYVIVKGPDDKNIYKRARHPSLIKSVNEIDKNYYIEQALRSIQRLGVDIKPSEIALDAVSILDFSLD
ncbi:MAG: DNA-directed DNA polymerase [Candidatus Heimdallarchaeum aukensis]|uniref:DNA-directed DNA polymerase n=1 Tax=Candidatus Heimdallarchaeum aukensis TaxID=2876573 RepID=A0A9Y1BLD7_9ARCH|nr:MAG: DNA-directed DNA polymerase [Candidatus Heimdallarchaeum aukensis]